MQPWPVEGEGEGADESDSEKEREGEGGSVCVFMCVKARLEERAREEGMRYGEWESGR